MKGEFNPNAALGSRLREMHLMNRMNRTTIRCVVCCVCKRRAILSKYK